MPGEVWDSITSPQERYVCRLQNPAARQDRRRISHAARAERALECRDLHAAPIDPQPRQIIAQHGDNSVGRGQFFLFAAQSTECSQCLGEEMATAAARVEHREFGGTRWPAWKHARCRTPNLV